MQRIGLCIVRHTPGDVSVRRFVIFIKQWIPSLAHEAADVDHTLYVNDLINCSDKSNVSRDPETLLTCKGYKYYL